MSRHELTVSSGLQNIILILLLFTGPSLRDASNVEDPFHNGLQHMEPINGSNVYDWIRLYVRQYSGEYYKFETIEETVDQRAANLNKVHLMARFMTDDMSMFDQDDPELQGEYERFTTGPEVDPKQCTKHLERMVSLLDEISEFNSNKRKGIDVDRELNEEHIHFIKILDSFGRYESGLLDGKHILAPINRECYETRLILDRNDTESRPTTSTSTRPFVKMRVCYVNIELSKHLDERLRSRDSMKFSGRSEGTIRFGICLPSSCHSRDLLNNKHLIQHLVDDQITAPDYLYVSESWELGDDMVCLNDRERINNMDPSKSRIVLIAFITWFSAIVIATLYEANLCSPFVPHSIRKIATCLNIKRSIDRLLSFRQNDRVSRAWKQSDRVNLDALNFIKFLNMAAVIASNTWLLHISRSTSFSEGLSLYEKNLFVRWLMHTPILVDSTFVISATLLSFAILKRLDRYGKSYTRSVRKFAWVFFSELLRRYLRFVPLLFVYHWLKKNVMLYLGYGAFWDPGYNKHTPNGACKQEKWWVPLTPMSAYLPLGKQCLPQAWSIGYEIVAAILIIPLAMVIRRQARMVLFISVSLAVAAISLTYSAISDKIDRSGAWKHLIQLDATSVIAFFNEGLSAIYIRPFNQIGASLIGLWTGYVLYLYDSGSICVWPRWLKGPGTKASLLVAISLLFFKPLLLTGSTGTSVRELLVLHSFAGFRLMWAVANMILILRLTTDWTDAFILGKIFRGSFIKTASKLHLSMLLIHMDFIMISSFLAEGITATSVAIGLISEALSAYLYSLMLAVPVYVFIENPCHELIELALSGDEEVRKAQQRQR